MLIAHKNINMTLCESQRRAMNIPFAQQCLRNPKSIVKGVLPRSSSYSISTSNVAHERICHKLKHALEPEIKQNFAEVYF
jgi:hypothetical protein